MAPCPRRLSARLNAPTAIALHGFTGSGRDFEPLIAACDAALPCPLNWILPDFPGHGTLASLEDREAYSLSATLERIRVARASVPEDSSQVILIAYSMGARIALHYLRGVERLPALLLSGSPGIIDHHERVERLKADRCWIEILERTGMEAFANAWEQQAIIASQVQLPEPLRTEVAMRRRANRADGLVRSLEAIGNGALPELWSALPELPPAIIAYGERDRKFARISRLMASLNPKLSLCEIAGCHHSPHLENPIALVEPIRSLLLL